MRIPLVFLLINLTIVNEIFLDDIWKSGVSPVESGERARPGTINA